MKKQFSALLLSSAFALSTIGTSFIPRNANAQSSSRPYIVLVNGWQNCCAWGVKDRFPPMNAEFRSVPYSNFSQGGFSGNTSDDSAFLRDGAEFINNKLDRNRPLILIGHSFGGDSVLKLLPRINRQIQFVAVIDPVRTGGFRTSLKNLRVPNNVNYFFNRWQENLPFPNDFKTNGSIPCNAKTCDQDSQNIARNADYSPVTTECRWDEVTCPGFVAPIPFVRKGKKGRKQVRVGHQDLPKDAFLQKDLGDKIQKRLAAFHPPASTPANTSQPVQNTFAAIARSEQTGSLGWSWGYSNQAEAEKGAIQACKASDCKSIMWVQNRYAAIAYGDDLSWATVGGKSQEEVSQKAIQSCKQVAQNPQSCTVVTVVESTKGAIVNNSIPTKKIAALDPQWKYSVFTYEDTRYGGQGKIELKKTSSIIVAEQTTGKGESSTYSLLEGKPDYIIITSNLAPDSNYYIKLYSNGNVEWTAGKNMSENGWQTWGSGQWVDEQNQSPSAAAKPESNGCVSVDSKLGWQHFNLPGNFTKVASISGGWSVDTRSYAPVGAAGHTGNDAELLEPYKQYKYDQNFPFGALIVDIPTDGHGYIWVQEPQQLPKPISETTIRINDADNALGDNEGNLQVCFGN
jgi:pimeloyl-ACP methyl ester carboxylesterase